MIYVNYVVHGCIVTLDDKHTGHETRDKINTFTSSVTSMTLASRAIAKGLLNLADTTTGYSMHICMATPSLHVGDVACYNVVHRRGSSHARLP